MVFGYRCISCTREGGGGREGRSSVDDDDGDAGIDPVRCCCSN